MNFLLACMLMTCPLADDTEETLKKSFGFVKLDDDLQFEVLNFCVRHQLMCDVERQQHSSWSSGGIYGQSPVGDLANYRRRYFAYRDEPPIYFVDQFSPNWDGVDSWSNFNRTYVQNLKNGKATNPDRAWRYDEAIDEAEKLQKAWDLAAGAHNPSLYLSYRRWAFKELRGVLGDKDFFLAKMPFPVPLHRFKEIE